MAAQHRKRDPELLAMLIATGKSVKDAADQAGFPRRTAYRRAADPDFVAAVDELKTNLRRRAADALSALAVHAAKVLQELTGPRVPPAVRLGACRTILELGIRVGDNAEALERLKAVERRLDENDKPRLAAG